MLRFSARQLVALGQTLRELASLAAALVFRFGALTVAAAVLSLLAWLGRRGSPVAESRA